MAYGTSTWMSNRCALPACLKYQTLMCPPPATPICSSSAFPSQVVVPPSPPPFLRPQASDLLILSYPQSASPSSSTFKFHSKLSTHPAWSTATVSLLVSFLPGSPLFRSPLSRQSDPLYEEIWPCSSSAQTHQECLLTRKVQRDY